jgi:hypothetical protein
MSLSVNLVSMLLMSRCCGVSLFFVGLKMAVLSGPLYVKEMILLAAAAVVIVSMNPLLSFAG